MDFDAVAEELYAGPRDAFISARAAKAAEAKAAGDGELAKRIKELKKPSIAAWLVNRVAREHADELSDLFELGQELREAHADLDGERLRQLTQRKHAVVQRLADRARKLGSEPSGGVVEQITATLEAAVSNAEVAAQVAAGVLDAAVAPSGFDSWLVAPVGSSAGRKPSARESTAGDEAAADDSPAARRRQAKLAEAVDAAASAESAREEAEGVLARADDAVKQAAAAAADLQARLAVAERELRKQREVAGQARRAYDAAVRAADAARRAVQRIELQ